MSTNKETPEELSKYPDVGNDSSKIKDAAQVCYDCLKTRGFWISLSIIVTSALVFSAFIYEEFYPANIITIILFVIFWSVIFVFIGVMILLSGAGIKDYCKKDDNQNYKNPSNLAWFVICGITAIGISMLVVDHIETNYNHYLIPDTDIVKTVFNDDGSQTENIRNCWNLPFSYSNISCENKLNQIPSPVNWLPVNTLLSKTTVIDDNRYWMKGEIKRDNNIDRKFVAKFVMNEGGLVSESDEFFCEDNQVRLISDNRCISDEHWHWNAKFIKLVPTQEVDWEAISEDDEVVMYETKTPEQMSYKDIQIEVKRDLVIAERTAYADREYSITGFYESLDAHPRDFVNDDISCTEFQILYNHQGNLWSDWHDDKQGSVDAFAELRPDCLDEIIQWKPENGGNG